ncbi:putative TMV resistance protein N [Corchorus olitorius]|uniref:TMV resistance protein N n=1 Tax=Corchorus olitorius TaxID=93759 RepID=A0A1R3HFG7_9ROSI|nr:putative TMV resistance protein N [Corchorus olitorius]
MSSTKVKNIPSSISELDALWNLNLSNCPNITELNLNGTPPNQEQPSLVQPLNIPSSIKLFKLAQLTNLKVQECNSLKSLSGLPLSLEQLFATGCPSLQSVSFGGNYQRVFCNLPQQFNFLFDNCFNLNQDARDNSLAAFLMIIKVLAKQSAMQLKLHVIPRWYDEFPRLIYCLPGYEIFDKFENKSKNSSITVKLDSGTSITRFLCFALCVILDYNHFDEFGACSTYVYCEYQLKGIYGFQNFRRAWRSGKWGKRECDFQVHPIRISNDHVFVMFSNDMVHKDMEYEEASFDFKVTCSCYDDDDGDDDDDDYDDDDVADVHEERKVNECGVHVFYVDAYTFNVSDASCNINFSSEEGIMQS